MKEKKVNQRSKTKAWYIVFINSFVGCGLAATFPQFSMTVAQLEEKSGISQQVLLTSDTVKACGIVVSMLVSGFIYNKFGAKKTFVYAASAIFLPQFLLPHLSSVPVLMLLKAFQGTASVMFPIFLVIILNWVDEKDAGLSTAVFNGIFYGGGGIGGTFAGFFIAKNGWISSYYALGILQVAICAVWFITVREKPDFAKKTADTFEPVQNDREEVEIKEKKKQKNLLFTPQIWLLSIAFFSTTWTVQAITVDMSLYGVYLGYDEISVGKILSAVTIAMIISCLISGKTSDFFAKKSSHKGMVRLMVLMLGHLLIVGSVMMIAFLDTTKFVLFYITAFLITFGGSWGLGSFYSILPEFYDEDQVPIVTGITGGIGDAGMPISPLVVGVFFGIRGHWEMGWMSCAAAALLGFAAAFILIMRFREKTGN